MFFCVKSYKSSGSWGTCSNNNRWGNYFLDNLFVVLCFVIHFIWGPKSYHDDFNFTGCREWRTLYFYGRRSNQQKGFNTNRISSRKEWVRKNSLLTITLLTIKLIWSYFKKVYNWFLYIFHFRHYIRRTLERHKLDRAMIRIPLNISHVALTKLNQPPWLIWWYSYNMK